MLTVQCISNIHISAYQQTSAYIYRQYLVSHGETLQKPAQCAITLDMTKRYDLDLVAGARAIGEVIGTTGEGAVQLHMAGRLPAARIGHTLVANRAALLAAKADWAKQGRRRYSKGRWRQEAAEDVARDATQIKEYA